MIFLTISVVLIWIILLIFLNHKIVWAPGKKTDVFLEMLFKSVFINLAIPFNNKNCKKFLDFFQNGAWTARQSLLALGLNSLNFVFWFANFFLLGFVILNTKPPHSQLGKMILESSFFSSFMTYYNEIVFVLADGRPLECVFIFFVSILLGFFIFENFLLFVCFFATLLHAISPLVLISIIFGERIGNFFKMQRTLSRKKNQQEQELHSVGADMSKSLFLQLGLVQMTSFFASFILIGYLKDFFIFSSVYLEILSLGAIVVLLQTLAQLAWGHYQYSLVQAKLVHPEQ